LLDDGSQKMEVLKIFFETQIPDTSNKALKINLKY